VIVLHSRAVENRGKKRGSVYDLGGAKQRTAIDVKKRRDENKERRGEKISV
jgi:hypothetical protein